MEKGESLNRSASQQNVSKETSGEWDILFSLVTHSLRHTILFLNNFKTDTGRYFKHSTFDLHIVMAILTK